MGLQAGLKVDLFEFLELQAQLAAIRTVPVPIGQVPKNGNHLEQNLDISGRVLGSPEFTLLSLRRETSDSINWGPVKLGVWTFEHTSINRSDVHLTFDAALIIGIHLDVNLTQTGRNIGHAAALEMHRITGDSN